MSESSLFFALVLLANGVVTFLFGLAFMVGGCSEKRFFTACFGLIIGVFGIMQTVSVGYVIYKLLTGGI